MHKFFVNTSALRVPVVVSNVNSKVHGIDLVVWNSIIWMNILKIDTVHLLKSIMEWQNISALRDRFFFTGMIAFYDYRHAQK